MTLFDLLLAPAAATLLLAGIHCYFGLFVVARGVIFVDLSLAQLAALGSAVALLSGVEGDSNGAYFFSLGFTFFGAAIFALTRRRLADVPQEALIGIVYAVASAVAILILDRSPHGQEEIKSMLVGSILFVDWPTIGKTGVLYAVIGGLHALWYARFRKGNAVEQTDGHAVLWDFLFYATFGVVVTSSVKLAGVLLVFSFLIIPTVVAMLFVTGFAKRLIFGWVFSAIVSVIGLYASATFDLPSGAAVVGVFGATWAVAMIIAGFREHKGAT